MLVSIITIGDELLIGPTLDTNSTWIGQELIKMGARVYQKFTIADDRQQIMYILDLAIKSTDIVLITGGLGPTKDDITKETISTYFNCEMKIHPATAQRIEDYFTKSKLQINDRVKSIALVPAGATVLTNEAGLAPALFFDHNDKYFFFMPGVPNEMKYLMQRHILPFIKNKITTPIYTLTLRTAGAAESVIAEKIIDLESDLISNGISLAYLPDYNQVRLRLSGKGDIETKKYIHEISHKIIERLGSIYYATGSLSLVAYIGQILLQKKLKLAIAESCTGGKIASTIVEISGCSEYFVGGITAYNNEIKNNLLNVNQKILDHEGAVSIACTEAMLQGVIPLLKGDIGIAVSGIAGPNGGTPDKPVGMVCISVGNMKNTLSKIYYLNGNRESIIQWSTNIALNQLRLFIGKESNKLI